MKVVVTVGAGFIGANLCRALTHGESDVAVEVVERALELQPTLVPAWVLRARAWPRAAPAARCSCASRRENGATPPCRVCRTQTGGVLLD